MPFLIKNGIYKQLNASKIIKNIIPVKDVFNDFYFLNSNKK
ncbi:hypothetical protein CLV00_2384 [Flavobacterium sp. 11]|nr:hypothetical protein CLV00_2384 [Flavobacterium sp. 11]